MLPDNPLGTHSNFQQQPLYLFQRENTDHWALILLISDFTSGIFTCIYTFPGEGNGNPLQYSCLENPMDGGAW